MDRVVSQLCAELDAAATPPPGVGGIGGAMVFVLAATNRVDLLDTALLRPGRLDVLVFLPPCGSREGQLDVLRALTRKIPLGGEVDLAQIAERLPAVLTGADLYALCADALGAATRELLATSLTPEIAAAAECPEVCARHFEAALRAFQPSLSAHDLVRYEEHAAARTGGGRSGRPSSAAAGTRVTLR
mmetsp:Transcript_23757/g.60160  ORF Transcript_23757/g.60160 Transcript_23757/m.60160 type:complete len:188 (-) Transcript_23757:132-695(-)